MQPLEYKNIGSEEHLTFDSIRRLALHELSELSEREAKNHIEECERCKGIYASLITPNEIRQQNAPVAKVSPMLVGIVSVFVLIGLAASVLYFGAESKAPEKVAQANPETSTTSSEIAEEPEVTPVAPIIEAIDTLAQVSEEPEVEPSLPTNKQFDEYIEKEQTQTRVKLKGIYGKITADGKPLPGVTVLVPGSRSGRVSDTGGKYYIQVPRNANALLFIYQGKQLLKDLDPDKRRLDLNLKSESLDYPETNDVETPANIDG